MTAAKAWDPSGITPKQLEERQTTLEGLIAAREARAAHRNELSEYLARKDISGPERMTARCAYILRQGRLPFQCRGCWLLPGNCICNSLFHASPKTKIVLHLHVDEWSKGSNTGCLCAASLEGCEMLMKGHKDHDERLQQLLDDPSYTTAVLWPGDEALEPQQLQQLAAERSGGRIALIAIDATWDGANRMRKRYPPSLPMLKLPAQLTLQHHAAAWHQEPPGSQQDNQPTDGTASGALEQAADVTQQGGSDGSQGGAIVSLFRPLRQYRGNAAANGRVCTLEAVAAALFALEGSEEVYQGLLHNLKLKVDAMRHQKHLPPVYGTLE